MESIYLGAADVSHGSKADLTGPKSDFRFTLESGLKSDIAPCPFRANNGSGELYSITSSARASIVVGTSRPSALATFRLTINSTFVDC